MGDWPSNLYGTWILWRQVVFLRVSLSVAEWNWRGGTWKHITDFLLNKGGSPLVQ